ncbi:MAG: hypothetical protein J5J00_09115 [Deltaproteobacteria bacterium]|nr:hypothetical protein [Deltaproteobacteria bacterium]
MSSCGRLEIVLIGHLELDDLYPQGPLSQVVLNVADGEPDLVTSTWEIGFRDIDSAFGHIRLDSISNIN